MDYLKAVIGIIGLIGIAYIHENRDSDLSRNYIDKNLIHPKDHFSEGPHKVLAPPDEMRELGYR